MRKKDLPKADLIASLGFMALGTLTVVESLRLPTLEERSVPTYSAPGVVPGLLGCAIFALALPLFVRSIRTFGRGFPVTDTVIDGEPRQGAVGRLFLALVLAMAYALLLVGNLPYWLATGLFIFIFIAVFEWRLRIGRQERVRMLGAALGLAIVVSAVVSLVFEKLFLVRLP